MVGTRVAKIRFQREAHHLYYVKSDENGWLEVWKSPMRKKKEKPNPKRVMQMNIDEEEQDE